MLQWDAQKQTFLTEVEKLEASVKQIGEEKKKFIDRHIDSLLQELQYMKCTFLKEVDCNKDKLETTAVAMQSYINYSHTVRDKGNSSDITHAADELNTRATSLLATDVLSKTIQSPVIQLVPADDQNFSVVKDVNSVGRWSIGYNIGICDTLASISIDNHVLQRLLEHYFTC